MHTLAAVQSTITISKPWIKSNSESKPPEKGGACTLTDFFVLLCNVFHLSILLLIYYYVVSIDTHKCFVVMLCLGICTFARVCNNWKYSVTVIECPNNERSTRQLEGRSEKL